MCDTSFRRGGLAVLPLTVALAIGGCGRTLVFVERTGFNMSIAVRPAETTPIDVNFGLERKVASIVPPAGNPTPQGQVDGEAVNMFAGFAAAYDVGAKDGVFFPLQSDLTIRTQFASGAAATGIASDAAAVAKVVDVSGAIVHNRALRYDLVAIQNKAEIKAAIAGLTAAQQVRLANEMLPNLSSRTPQLQAEMRAFAPSGRFLPSQQAAAASFLAIWTTEEQDWTGSNFPQWQAAIKKVQ